jgi:hypothetical protein
MLQKTIDAHKGGFICTIRFSNGKLYSGGKDGNVVITNAASHTVEKSLSLGSLVRAVDAKDGQLLVGMRDGKIFHFSDENNESSKKMIMVGHNEGEVWGLACNN